MSKVNSISNKKVGRRPGKEDSKALIIKAAQLQFAEHGYDRATLRLIANKAAVDPALIVHYFGTKQELFVSSMLPLFELPKLLPSALQGNNDDIGTRLATMFIRVTSNPDTQQLMLGLIRSISSEERAATMARKFFNDNIINLVKSHLSGPYNDLQANIVSSQMIGVFMAKYVMKIEPLASASDDDTIQYLAISLQAHFN
jgi:AcrR family transcriptional regulator